MRTLHLVESDREAGRLVLETSDGHEKFELPIDTALRSALTETRATPATPTTRPAAVASEPQITPREIQMRVRAGETPESIAEAFRADLGWVQRFAAPVVAERERIADEARRAKARRSTTDGQVVVFGEAVDERFAAHGIDPQTVRWDAHRREDGQWVLAAHWVGGQAERQAEWSFQLSGRTVAPLDDTAADLLSDRPIHALPAPSEPEPTAPALTLAPPLVPGLVAFPAMPDAQTGRLPRAEDVFDQARFEQAKAEQAKLEQAKFEQEQFGQTTVDESGFDEPPLPIDVPDAPPARRRGELGAPRREESEDEKAARASIPSWDDILLGVRRKRD